MKQESIFWTGFLGLIFIIPIVIAMCGPCWNVSGPTPPEVSTEGH
jgi:hypothetical protein